MALIYTVPAGDLDIVDRKLRIVRGSEEKRQKVKQRLAFFKGEWFLDQRLGFPWFELVFVKNPNLTILERLFQRAVLLTPGALSIQAFTMNLDNVNRHLSVAMEVLFDDGDVAVFDEQEPFVLDIAA